MHSPRLRWGGHGRRHAPDFQILVRSQKKIPSSSKSADLESPFGALQIADTSAESIRLGGSESGWYYVHDRGTFTFIRSNRLCSDQILCSNNCYTDPQVQSARTALTTAVQGAELRRLRVSVFGKKIVVILWSFFTMRYDINLSSLSQQQDHGDNNILMIL